MVWKKVAVPNPVLLSPRDCGWAMDDEEWVPLMTTLAPAPKAIIPTCQVQVLKDAPAIDVSAADLGFSVQTVVPMIVTARTSKTKTM